MAGLFFDGDVRRIYEVPTNPAYTMDGLYRVYSGPGEAVSLITSIYAWSRWVDYHYINQWALLAFSLSGGALRSLPSDAIQRYALADMRLINDWHFVPANYSHDFFIDGNILPNESTGKHFDKSRITEKEVNTQINSSDQGERTLIGSGLTASQDQRLSLIEKILRNKLITDPSTGQMTLYDDNGQPLLTAPMYEDADGNQPYRGEGSERRERLE